MITCCFSSIKSILIDAVQPTLILVIEQLSTKANTINVVLYFRVLFSAHAGHGGSLREVHGCLYWVARKGS